MTESEKALPRVAALLEGRSVLDLGCGRRKVVPWAVGVDDMSEQSGCSPADVTCGIEPGGGLAAALGGRLFDVVFSSHALEHMPSPPAQTVAYWAGFAKPGGLVVLYLPDERYYVYDPADPSAKNPAHRHLLTMDSFLPCLSGLRALRVRSAEMDLGEDRYSFLVVLERLE